MKTNALMVPRDFFCRVEIPGRAHGKGSHRTFPHPTTGRMMVVDADPDTRAWQDGIGLYLRQAGPHGPYLGAFLLSVTVYVRRPASHYDAEGELLGGAPLYPAAGAEAKGDLDKIVRAVQDCGTGILYVDDSQVTSIEAGRRYGEGAKTVITVAADGPGSHP